MSLSLIKDDLNTKEDKQAVIDELSTKNDTGNLSNESSTFAILEVAYKVEQMLKLDK